MYWTGGGFDWTDLAIGLGGVPTIIASSYLFLKIAPRQKNVAKIDYIYKQLRDNYDDGIGNIYTVISLQAQKSKALNKPMDTDLIIQKCEEIMAIKKNIMKLEKEMK
jgi:hypothetical protein